MPEFNTWFPTSTYGSETLNAKSFGCVGDGSNDDGPSMQLALNAIQTSGNARALYIPPGIYRTNQVLYITNTTSVRIFGDGPNLTCIRYTGAANAGNVEGENDSGPGFNASEITPVIMTNGWSYSSMEGLNLHNAVAGTKTCAMYIYQNTPPDKGITTSNVYKNVYAYGLDSGGVTKAATGFLIGWNHLCSEQCFIACYAGHFEQYGWSIVAQNALNIGLIGCSGIHNGVWTRCAVGHMYIHGGSLAANTVDIELGNVPVVITGVRTESAQFIDMSHTQGYATILGCTQTGAGAGYFVSVESSGIAVIEGCFIETISHANAGRILGGSGRVFMKGNFIRNAVIPLGGNINTSAMKDFTGQIMEFNNSDMFTTVSTLPTVNIASWEGIHLFVTDATATTFNSIVAGGGSNKVPVWCDGTNWKIG